MSIYTTNFNPAVPLSDEECERLAQEYFEDGVLIGPLQSLWCKRHMITPAQFRACFEHGKELIGSTGKALDSKLINCEAKRTLRGFEPTFMYRELHSIIPPRPVQKNRPTCLRVPKKRELTDAEGRSVAAQIAEGVRARDIATNLHMNHKRLKAFYTTWRSLQLNHADLPEWPKHGGGCRKGVRRFTLPESEALEISRRLFAGEHTTAISRSLKHSWELMKEGYLSWRAAQPNPEEYAPWPQTIGPRTRAAMMLRMPEIAKRRQQGESWRSICENMGLTLETVRKNYQIWRSQQSDPNDYPTKARLPRGYAWNSRIDWYRDAGRIADILDSGKTIWGMLRDDFGYTSSNPRLYARVRDIYAAEKARRAAEAAR